MSGGEEEEAGAGMQLGVVVAPTEGLGIRPGNNSHPFSSFIIPSAQPSLCSLMVSLAPFYYKTLYQKAAKKIKRGQIRTKERMLNVPNNLRSFLRVLPP